ncbi:hypothetical protein D0T49_07025 [Paludibacter sp. 221]|nr:hypothetical protein [Paludibacter sp. 221]
MFCLFQFSFFIFNANAQVTIGADRAPNDNAILELASANKGLLLPRVTLTDTETPSPLNNHVAGMAVYNTATAGADDVAVTPGMYYNDGTRWVRQQEATTSRTIVFVDTTNPNNANTRFDDVSPTDDDGNANVDFSDDASLKAKTAYLYVSTDGKIWIYNGTSYVAYNQPVSTAWYRMGTSVDAGENKKDIIWRNGGLFIGVSKSSMNTKFYTYGKSNTSNWVLGSNGYQQSYMGIISSTAIIDTPIAANPDSKFDQRGLFVTAYQEVPEGKTNNGVLIGQRVNAFRSSEQNQDNKGSLNTLYGMQINYGHIGQNNTLGTTEYSYGLYIAPYSSNGTINRMIDIYATSGSDDMNVTERWGIYILGTNKKNFIQGKLGVGAGSSSQIDVALNVVGYMKISGTDATAAANPQNGMIRYNSATSTFQGYANGEWKDFH